MPVDSLFFFPGALLEQVGNEAFLFSFGVDKVILTFRGSFLLI